MPCLYCLNNFHDKRVGGGTLNHFENGMLLQKIKDIMLIVITKKILNFCKKNKAWVPIFCVPIILRCGFNPYMVVKILEAYEGTLEEDSPIDDER
jgi:hypothetical protein